MVQIYYSTSSSNRNRWGNICDDGLFAGNEANVICNQLGYNGASGYGRAGSTSRYYYAHNAYYKYGIGGVNIVCGKFGKLASKFQ